MKRTVLIAVMILGLAGFAFADRPVDETRPLTADGRVEISNISGSVTVIGWQNESVSITGTLGRGIEDLEISSGGSRLRVEVVQTRRTGYSGDAYLTLKVPIGASLDVETVSADITANGVMGELDLESVSGDLEVDGSPRSLSATSVSGDVIVTAFQGAADLESVSGDITVRRADGGRLEASVVSGNIEVGDGALTDFDAESVSGSIFCFAHPSNRARFRMETMSGVVEMRISPEMNADFYVETYSGSIRNDIGPEAKRTDKYSPGKELRFSLGSGDARISIESFSGSVRLRTD